MREYNRRGILYLVVEEFTEILHIHLTLTRIYNGRKAVEVCGIGLYTAHRADNVGKLTYTRRLDNYSVGDILLEHLRKRL